MVVGISADHEERLRPFFLHEKKVCSIGTFIPDYGFAHVANAVEALREKTGTNVGLLLLDGAFATDQRYRELVLKDRPWITVLSDVPNPDIYQILHHCDLFVRASGSEGYGISRVEAIWCGAPVVATNVGETRGMLTYEFGDERKLAELLQKVLSHGRIDLTSTAELFRAEADRNLRKFVETVKLETSDTSITSVSP
jgi:glycosyltransferase involved in cell wall biosynthesis